MNRQVLLIFPPQVNTCYLQIYPSLPSLASSLEAEGSRVKQLDLNNEFIEWYIESEAMRSEVLKALNLSERLEKKRVLDDDEYERYICAKSLNELMAMLRKNHSSRQGFAPRLIELTGAVLKEPITNQDLKDMLRNRGGAVKIIHEFYSSYFQSAKIAKPLFVGISVAMLPQVVPAMLLTRWLKDKLWNDVKVFWGGPMMSLLGDETLGVILKDGYADGVIMGEGEEAAQSIAAQLEKGSFRAESVPNFVYRRDSAIVKSISKPTKHIREYPPPRYDKEELKRCSQSMISALLSRSCSWGKCAFCEYPRLYSRRQCKEPEDVVRDLRYLIAEFPEHPIWLSCDMVEPTYMRKLCKAIISEGLKFRWMGYLRADDRYSLSDLKLMKKAGCFRVSVGLESLNTEVLKRINKGYTADQAIGFLRNLMKSGIEAQINMIVDLPGTTYDSALEQYGVIEKLVEEGASKGVGYSVMATPLLVSKSSPMGTCPKKYGIELDVSGNGDKAEYINCLPYHDDTGMSDDEVSDILSRYRRLDSFLTMMRVRKGDTFEGISPSSVLEIERKSVFLQEQLFEPGEGNGRHIKRSPPLVRIFNLRSGQNATMAEWDIVRWLFQKLPMSLEGITDLFTEGRSSSLKESRDELLGVIDRLISIGVIRIRQ